MKPKIQAIIADCIETGITRGYDRAFKHLDKPSKDVITSSIEDAIWSEIYTYFQFEDIGIGDV